MNVTIRLASPDDMPFITECIDRFKLDDEDLDFRQFIVAADGNEIVGFGRIRPHKEVYELGCVGVIESRRNQGIGRMIIEHLINVFPSIINAGECNGALKPSRLLQSAYF